MESKDIIFNKKSKGVSVMEQQGRYLKKTRLKIQAKMKIMDLISIFLASLGVFTNILASYYYFYREIIFSFFLDNKK